MFPPGRVPGLRALKSFLCKITAARHQSVRKDDLPRTFYFLQMRIRIICRKHIATQGRRITGTIRFHLLQKRSVPIIPPPRTGKERHALFTKIHIMESQSCVNYYKQFNQWIFRRKGGKHFLALARHTHHFLFMIPDPFPMLLQAFHGSPSAYSSHATQKNSILEILMETCPLNASHSSCSRFNGNPEKSSRREL